MSDVLLIGHQSETTQTITQALGDAGCSCEHTAGGAGAIRRLRQQAFDVVITDPHTTSDEDLALIEEIRHIRPGTKVILLATSTTPEAVIAALRARVFVCLSAPFDVHEIADFARKATASYSDDWRTEIEVLSAQPDWVSLRANCRRLTAERVVTFLDELHSELSHVTRDEFMIAFREILLKAMEGRADSNRHKVMEISAIRTERTLVFYVRDPGTGFRREALPRAALTNAPGRPSGFGFLVAQGVVDEFIYNEGGNEVLLIKHTT